MKLREIVVKNFRCFANVSVPIGDTTVLVGENNSGKTALLDALKLALPRNPSRGSTCEEYDYQMLKGGDCPQSSEGIVIELWFKEDAKDEWPASLIQALDPVVQTNPVSDMDSIGLRVTSKFEAETKEMVTKWEFLNLDGAPVGGKGSSPANLGKFLTYIRLFYLSALRDSDEEFSPRSQFWGRILRDLKISPEQQGALQEDLEKLNNSLLSADPRLNDVRDAIGSLRSILSIGSGESVSIRALPMQAWDLMSRAQLVIRPTGNEVDFPLERHGQGMQSLAVMFLFQAYIDVLLKPTFEPETEAILGLEEPEAHLHPQAARALGASLGKFTSQKIISSHSPYFVQEIPFKDIRIFRRTGATSKVLHVRQTFEAQLPPAPKLDGYCAANSPKFDYEPIKQWLTVRGEMTEKEYRDLLTLYSEQKETHADLKKLYKASQRFLSDDDLGSLDTFAKRIRGEVLFARAWLLCEGQSEYLLLRYFADLLGTPLDQFGITVIDFQNNGSPEIFARLAQVFEIPWMLLCDNDPEGLKFVKQVSSHLTAEEAKDLVRPIPDGGADLEPFLRKMDSARNTRKLCWREELS
jgi:putative ATP-dependent endonuclease of OLD family